MHRRPFSFYNLFFVFLSRLHNGERNLYAKVSTLIVYASALPDIVHRGIFQSAEMTLIGTVEDIVGGDGDGGCMATADVNIR